MINVSEKKISKLWSKSADLNNPKRTECLHELATLLWTVGRNAESVEVAYALVDSLDQFANQEEWFEAKKLLGQCLYAAERFEESKVEMAEAIQMAELFGTGATYGILNWIQADNEAKLGNLDAQVRFIEIAITEFQGCGLNLTEGAARLDLGTAFYESGRLESALQYLTSAVELLESAKAVERVAFTKFKIAKVLFDQSSFTMSRKYFEDSRALYKFLNREGDVKAASLELARCAVALLELEKAKVLFKEAKSDIVTELGQLSAAKATFYYGMMILGSDQDAEAREMLIGIEPVLRALKLEELSSTILELHL